MFKQTAATRLNRSGSGTSNSTTRYRLRRHMLLELAVALGIDSATRQNAYRVRIIQRNATPLLARRNRTGSCFRPLAWNGPLPKHPVPISARQHFLTWHGMVTRLHHLTRPGRRRGITLTYFRNIFQLSLLFWTPRIIGQQEEKVVRGKRRLPAMSATRSRMTGGSLPSSSMDQMNGGHPGNDRKG